MAARHRVRNSIAAGITAALVSVQAVRTTAAYRRAMADCRAESAGVCAHAAQGCPWTNGVRVVPHHRIPVWQVPRLATERTNLVALCDPADTRRAGCHLVCGHGGNWRGVGDCGTCRNRRKEM